MEELHAINTRIVRSLPNMVNVNTRWEIKQILITITAGIENMASPIRSGERIAMPILAGTIVVGDELLLVRIDILRFWKYELTR